MFFGLIGARGSEYIGVSPERIHDFHAQFVSEEGQKVEMRKWAALGTVAVVRTYSLYFSKACVGVSIRLFAFA